MGGNNMKLIVGLGNPTKEYENTRHNVGFMFLNYLYGEDSFAFNKKFNSMEYITSINGEKVLFVKPLSYMNLSGEVVIKYVNYYKINVNDIFVIQDDLDMPVGKYKLMFNHNDGGHNGIKNIILNLGSKEFLRLKIGISKSDLVDTRDYVLGKFNADELLVINNVFVLLKEIIDDYMNVKMEILMGKYNTRSKIQEG